MAILKAKNNNTTWHYINGYNKWLASNNIIPMIYKNKSSGKRPISEIIVLEYKIGMSITILSDKPNDEQPISTI